MITQVLLIGILIQTIDKILKKFTCTIGCNLVADVNASFAKKLSAMIRSMEHKREIIQAEGFLIIITGSKIVRVKLLHSQNYHIIGDKSKEYLSVFLAYPLSLFNAPQFVRFIVQMIQRAKEKDSIEGFTGISAQIQSIALNKVN